ncbi:MAG: O-antigen ligase family protein [Defluviitaleaceae bacterium]|nr:O-antigen ligase family protein [Defluviitaleaceae bacterium]
MQKVTGHDNSVDKNGFRAFTAVDWVSFIYLAVAVGIVPLIVRAQIVNTSADEMAAFIMDAQVVDFFAFAKARVLMFATLFAGMAYAFMYVGKSNVAADLRKLAAFEKGKIQESLHIKLALLMGLVFVLSAMFSSYRSTVLWGFFQRYEGLIVLICYIVVFFAAISFCRTRFKATLMLGIVSVSSLVVGGIAAFQYFGRDFFLTPAGARFVYGPLYQEGMQLGTQFNMAYSTLYNPNYLGQFAALVIPLFVFAIFAFGKRSKLSYALAALSALMLLAMLASRSSGALLALSAGVGFALVVVAAYFVRKGLTKATLIGLGAAFAAVVIIAVLPPVSYNITRMLDRFVTGTNVDAFFFQGLETGDGFAAIDTLHGELRLQINEAGTGVEFAFEGETIEPDEIWAPHEGSPLREAMYTVPYVGQVALATSGNIILLTARNITFNFAVSAEEGFFVLSQAGDVLDISQPVPSIGFEGRETFGTSRGYIWSRTLPIVLNAPLLGYGPDAFTFAFPQHDVIGKLSFFGEPYLVVDKPHNMYLQFAVNTGVVSMLLMVGLLVLFGLRTIWKVFTDETQDNFVLFMRLGLLVGIFAFAVSGLSTDSNVNTATVFWALLGMGYAMIEQN